MPFFNDLDLLPEDPILSLPIAFAADPRTTKVNLGIGAYRTAEGMPFVLTSVKTAEAQILQKNLNKDYLPIEGDQEFLQRGLQLLLGSHLADIDPTHIFAAQTVGGSGALRIGGEFLAKNVGYRLFLSQPSWSNHTAIFEKSGLSVGSYPYYDTHTHKIDFDGMCQAIQNMPPGSIILYHASCHNPSGVDPTFAQWEELSALIKKQQVIPFFDVAYQGFGQGIEQDVAAVRQFAKDGHEMLVAYSFAKNFGIYGERAGFLALIATNADATTKIASQIKTLVRGNYSTPPLHGARLIKTILKSDDLTQEWLVELHHMRDRIQEMRTAFTAALLTKGGNEKFAHIQEQKGLFSFCGLSSEQVWQLRQAKGIYMPSNGRINIAGLNMQNISYVVDAILETVNKNSS
jgi:aspartate/tyrosine/aromatic aminotransferase